MTRNVGVIFESKRTQLVSSKHTLVGTLVGTFGVGQDPQLSLSSAGINASASSTTGGDNVGTVGLVVTAPVGPVSGAGATRSFYSEQTGESDVRKSRV